MKNIHKISIIALSLICHRLEARIRVMKRHREIKSGLKALWDKGLQRKFA